MDTVIGLGNAGCTIAELFKQKYSNTYKIYKIDVDCEDGFALQQQNSPEEYEKNCPDLRQYLSDTDDDILFIVGGGGQVSGASLRILEQIKHKNINVLYICPESDQIGQVAFLQHRLAFNVFQEYAFSGLFRKLFLVHNKNLANIIGDVPIFEYNDRINSLIVDSVHYHNIYNNVRPVMSTLGKLKDNNRLCTFGLYSSENNSESVFFDMQNIDEKRYHFFVNNDVLKTDAKLYKNIKETISRQEIRSSYQILTTQHPQSFCYIEGYTNQNQALDSN
jgi:hypothetical protein